MPSDSSLTSSTGSQRIPHSRPSLGQEEIQAVGRVIASGQVAQGEQVRVFERTFARRTKNPDAVAVSSGTAALHLALMALDVGPGHEVVIPSYVCSALLHAVLHTGAKPVLAEIDPATWNLDPERVEQKITHKTRAIIAPHLFGLPADMDSLGMLGVPVIEDCAQALGAFDPNGPAGSWGDLSIFSFYATKVICTGEGGMVASRRPDLLERVRDLKSYDEKERFRMRFNYKTTNMAAAMGMEQLKKLPRFIRRREKIAAAYDEALKNLDVLLPPVRDGRIYFRYVIQLRGDSESAIRRLNSRGIGACRPIHRPLHLDAGSAGDKFEITQRAWENSLSLPLYPSLGAGEVERISKEVVRAIKDQGSKA